MDELLKATHQGKLVIGDRELVCAVLDGGTRVISQTAIFKAFGRPQRGRMKERLGEIEVPSFIDAKNLQPFIGADLLGQIKPIEYLSITGKPMTGYKAEILPLICDVYLTAREENALTTRQKPFAAAAEIIVRSLSKVGIIALVDEATGYQEERERNELQKLLAIYISEELLPWTKRFPDEFYKQIFRLRGWQYSPLSVKRPKYVGKITNEIIYEKLPPGVLEELKSKNPSNNKGWRKHRHHQFLTEDIGNPHLERHLISVITLMRASKNWAQFERLFKNAFPSEHDNLPLFDEDEIDNKED